MEQVSIHLDGLDRLDAVTLRLDAVTLGLDAVTLGLDGLDGLGAVGIVGESGSGTSLLARILAGLARPSGGVVTFNGRDLSRLLATRAGRSEFRRAVQFVGTDPRCSFDPRRSLRDAVRLPLRVLTRMSGSMADEQVDATLRELGLDPALAERLPHQVPDALRQRFAVARALVVQPRLLICDEPAAGLDESTVGPLRRYCVAHRTGLVLVATGLSGIASWVPRLVVMHRGQIVEQGSTRDVLERAEHPYAKKLIAGHDSILENTRAA